MIILLHCVEVERIFSSKENENNVYVPFPPKGVDIEAARKEEERIMLRDARQWLNSGHISDVRHAKSGGTALHVAAAKGYTEVLKYVLLSTEFLYFIFLNFVAPFLKICADTVWKQTI